MAQLPQVFLAFIVSCLATLVFVESVHVMLGDPVTFLAAGNCLSGEPAQLYRVEERTNRPVAARERGVCNPAEAYKDRVDEKLCFAFSRTVYSDIGLYALSCSEKLIQLDVLVGSELSLSEGQPATLRCFIAAGEHVDSVRWDRNGEVVLERHLSTGETAHGAGFESRASLSPDGPAQGDWSLFLDQVLLEDAGEYFCSARKKGVREEWGQPAAVRVKVTKKHPNQTTASPPLTTTPRAPEEKMGPGFIVMLTAIVLLLSVVAILAIWLWKSRRPHVSSGPRGGGRPSTDGTDEEKGLTERGPPGSLVNGNSNGY